MSSRALRKAQREREEQAQLQALEEKVQALENDEDEDDADSQPVQKLSAFALLGDGDAGGDTDEAEDDEAPQDLQTKDAQAYPDHGSTQTNKKKKKKNKKKKKSANESEPVEELDEIDAALKELSTRNHGKNQSGEGDSDNTQQTEAAHQLLSIDTSYLHAANEMRRLFGRAALQQEEDGEDDGQAAPAGANRRQQRQMQHGGLAQALRGQRQDGRAGGAASTLLRLRRNVFIQGKEEWPTASGVGLGMDVEKNQPDGTVLYCYVHNLTYQSVQSEFESGVASMDPNSLLMLLRRSPYHISTLLQVSEIAKQERDHAVSGDLLERALFSFGRTVHSTFVKNLTLGKARLDFRRAENREFWLASWRYMQNLAMRATWRTVYEWAKLLLALSPEDDPYALWLVLDQYALRSKQDLDYLNLSRSPLFKDRIRELPNVQLNQGLAEWRAGNKSKGQQALFTAIGKYPWVVARLMQELNLDPPPAIWGKQPPCTRDQLYTELYVTRGKDLWNTPETSALLLEIASAIPPDTPAAKPTQTDITRNEARHVLLSDVPSLIALVPRKYTSQLTNDFDPLPPDDAFMLPLSRQPGPPHRFQQATRSLPTRELLAELVPLDQLPSEEELPALIEEHATLQARVRRAFFSIEQTGHATGLVNGEDIADIYGDNQGGPIDPNHSLEDLRERFPTLARDLMRMVELDRIILSFQNLGRHVPHLDVEGPEDEHTPAANPLHATVEEASDDED